MVGASLTNGNLPLDDTMVGVFGGMAINQGDYLDLGKALIKDPRLSGYVINEAEAGATTLARNDCVAFLYGDACGAAHWRSYDEQFERALRRVSNPFIPGSINADYVFIGFSNDCFHSNAFGIPESQTTPCTADDINAYIDRLIAIGQKAIDLGITPIYDMYIDWNSINLASPLFLWTIDQTSYELMASIHRSRIQQELPGAVLLDIWEDYEAGPDLVHPTDKTARKAAKKLAKFITGDK
jgi:hypothetical protein